MKSIEYVIILKEPCVFSERNASEGAHRGLDYVPGSALLGAVASRLYSKLDVNESFKLFHSGHVRFGNAYPVNKQGRCTYPLPLSWVRQKKDESVINDDQTYEPSRIGQQDLLDDGTIEFSDTAKELMGRVRKLYISGFKNGNDADYAEFMKASVASLAACGLPRIMEAKSRLYNSCYELPSYTYDWGLAYILSLLIEG